MTIMIISIIKRTTISDTVIAFNDGIDDNIEKDTVNDDDNANNDGKSVSKSSLL